MPGNIGITEIAVVLIIVLIIFGPKRLPELGRSLGRGIREFKGSLGGENDDEPTSPAELHQGESKPAPVAATQSEGERPQNTSAGS